LPGDVKCLGLIGVEWLCGTGFVDTSLSLLLRRGRNLRGFHQLDRLLLSSSRAFRKFGASSSMIDHCWVRRVMNTEEERTIRGCVWDGWYQLFEFEPPRKVIRLVKLYFRIGSEPEIQSHNETVFLTVELGLNRHGNTVA